MKKLLWNAACIPIAACIAVAAGCVAAFYAFIVVWQEMHDE